MAAAAPNAAWDPLAALALGDAANDPETAEVVQLMQVKHKRRLADIAQTAVTAHRRAVNARLVQSAAAVESAVDRIAQDQHAWTAHARDAATRVAAARDEMDQRGEGLATSVASLLAQLDDQVTQSAKVRDEMVAAVHRNTTRTKDALAQLSRILTDHDRTTHDRLAAHLASVPSIDVVLADPAGDKRKATPPPPPPSGGDPMQGVERT
ncbi:hypothetical protein AMAG_04612 [Allomyces macrogynus ATCC 38327]|uniref:Uncharacterized protein n=1 Tax=Allomyces macrogynus (strain ATCC 38327) TaxID=578462 RepID=A0A0L0S5W7_ALLM3|nr:hypothetical protein AMAG_04612 [Allomyces macrogynus ATCC 38327]|eukprot:KNE57759.1 hypothetical protein AMAG_04612 [Allomyces macrogynus ATCC 38327]